MRRTRRLAYAVTPRARTSRCWTSRDDQVEAIYMVGVGKGYGPRPAKAYIDLLMGPEGAKCLEDAGLKPAGGAAERARRRGRGG